jgi:hypothetical protein
MAKIKKGFDVKKVFIQMKPVQSSNLKEIGYDNINRLLKVKFQNNSEYIYEGVSFKTYKELIEAESVGKYFNKHIAHGYTYTKL